MNRPKTTDPRSGLALLDDAIQLLRRAPGGLLCAYYLGSAPFVLGLLYYWTDMSRGAFAREHLTPAALGVALLYLWMKAWQAAFASGLRRMVAEEAPAPWSLARVVRLVLTQGALQPWGLVVRPIALLITIPYGWVRAYFENALVLGDGIARLPTVSAASIAHARLNPRENHLALGALLALALFVWLNVACLILAAPWILKTLFGVETIFVRNFRSMLNSNTFIAVCAVTYLCTNPVLKALYALRCFQGDSQRNGHDLLLSLRRSQLTSGGALVLALLLPFFGSIGFAAEPSRPLPGPAQVEPATLDRSIDRVLERPEYAWRMPRAKRAGGQSWIGDFIEGAFKTIGNALRPVAKWVGDMIEIILERVMRARDWSSTEPGDHRIFSRSLRISLYVLIAAGATLLGMLGWRAFRQRRQHPPIQSEAVPAVPDLTSEHLLADQLPEEGWLKLAREMIERGELRLALRAFYLAGLARLGAQELITIARHKSNRDYARELRRRARDRAPLQTAFEENLREFERAWYGDHPVSPGLLEHFTANLESFR